MTSLVETDGWLPVMGTTITQDRTIFAASISMVRDTMTRTGSGKRALVVKLEPPWILLAKLRP